MTAKEALEIIQSEYPGMSVIECFDLPDFYVFGMVEKGDEHKLVAGGCFTISKISGKLGTISPVRDHEIFCSAKPIDINTLNQK